MVTIGLVLFPSWLVVVADERELEGGGAENAEAELL